MDKNELASSSRIYFGIPTELEKDAETSSA